MIARLSVAPAALHDLTGDPPTAAAKAQHETLARALEAHGLLVLANGDEAKELVLAAREIGTAPPGAKDRWLAVLAEMKKSKRVRFINPPMERGLGEVDALEELFSGWGGRAQVAVMPTSQATALGADETGLLVDPESALELAAAPIAAYCKTLKDIRELADTGMLAYGAPRELFWRAVLMPICLLSRRITVLDQYLFTNLSWHCSNLPGSTRWEPESVVWLLQNLDRHAQRGTDVLLIGSAGGEGMPQDAAAAAGMVTERWRPAADGRLATVEVAAEPWRQGNERMPHDRHVRFSLSVGIKLHAGFGRLGRGTVQDADGMGWQYLWKPASVRDMRAAEARVLGGHETDRARVLDRTSEA